MTFILQTSNIFSQKNIFNNNSSDKLPDKLNKPAIDTKVFGKWPSLGSCAISNDGKYVLYTINDSPLESNTVVIKSVNNGWQIQIEGLSNADFTMDSKKVVFKTKTDSLFILKLGSSQKTFVSNSYFYKLYRKDQDEWLLYKVIGPEKELKLYNLYNNTQKSFLQVTNYLLNEKLTSLLLLTEKKVDSNSVYTLQWISLNDYKSKKIWQGKKSCCFVFDRPGEQVAFIADKDSQNAIWYYNWNMESAVVRVHNKINGVENGFTIGNRNLNFSKDGTRIFFSLQKIENKFRTSDGALVDIWSYTDVNIQSRQLDGISLNRGKKDYTSVFNFHNERVFRLEYDDEEILYTPLYGNNDSYILVRNQKGNPLEFNWNSACRFSLFLIATKDGSRKTVKENVSESLEYCNISPLEKYVVYFDPSSKNYFSYEIESGVTRNLTEHVPVSLIYEEADNAGTPPPIGVAAWLEQDAGILLYDEYDIWLVDPECKKAPINVTRGYGRKNYIKFRMAVNPTDIPLKRKNEEIILVAFNDSSKYNGFFNINLGKEADPILLTMGPYVYHWWNIATFLPIKARDKDIYIVKRMSANDAPNIYITRNFKNYIPVSNIKPHKDYNWLTTELVQWKTYDGNPTVGILYKPENFNPQKKYPVIIHFYTRLSHNLYRFPELEFSTGRINIPYYVSNDYLVFEPDIHYTIGKTGESIYNSVVSGAKYLFKMPWVDSTRIGIQGHSFGGYGVNYLITKTNIFTAAASACGMSNLISHYGSALYWWGSAQYLYEIGISRIRASLWQRPDLYIDNSPIFSVNKITTPLLLMNNKKDPIVPFSQGVELFLALRRLGKRAWMLQYDGGGHEIGGKDGEDYSVRLSQFFDHYLKVLPAPVWMTKGIKATSKGLDTGLDLDYNIKTPGPGLLK